MNIPSNAPTVFVVDDAAEIRQALQWLFETVHLSVETFESAAAFLTAYDPNRRGCLVLDVRMPGMSRLELLGQLKLRKNSLPIIVITGHGDIPMAVRAMKAGATNFIPKPFNDQYLLDLVQEAIIQNANVPRRHTFDHAIESYKSLTSRERDVMKLVVTGMLNKQIASELNIATSTVELHRSHVMEKMRAKTFADLIKISFALEGE